MRASDRIGARRLRMLVGAVLALATLAIFGRDLGRLTTRRPTATVIADEDFDEGAINRTGSVAVAGFVACAYGWSLPPGGKGTLVYSIEVPPTARAMRLTAWLYMPSGVHNAVEFSIDGGASFKRLLNDTPLMAGTLDVRVPASSPVVWRFTATNAGTSSQLVLDKIVLMALDHVARPEVTRTTITIAFAGFALAVALLFRRWRIALATAAVLTVAFYFRYGYLLAVANNPLDPDASGYLAYARSFRLFGPTGLYAAAFGEREPMFVFVAHLFLRCVLDSPYGLRLMGVVLSLLVVWAVTAFGGRLFGSLGGWLAGFAVAANQPLAREASRGLRLELEMLLWLAFLAAAFAWRRPRDGWKALALGGLGGILLLTRSTYLPVVIALEFLALFERPAQWRGLSRFAVHAGLAAMLTISIFAPHRYAMYLRYGDPLWDTGRYARWNANMEFAGKPGFPSRAQLQSNGYLGAPLSYSDYLFKLHTPRQLVEGTLRGYYKLFRGFSWVTDSDRSSASWWADVGLQLAALVGFSCSLLDWRWFWLPVAFVLCEFAPSFLYDRQLVESFRHTYQGLPLVVFATLVAGRSLASRPLLARLWRARGT